MKTAFYLGFGLLICANLANAGETQAVYTQSYTILLKGTVAGSETVTEKPGDAGDLVSTSDHEIFVTDGLQTKRMAFSTKMVLSKGTLAPVTYAYQYTAGNTGDSYDVVIKDAQIFRTLNRGGRSSEAAIPLQPNTIILDVNVYHQYDYLIRKYDSKKGGRQLFSDFVPVVGNDIPLALTFVGNENLAVKDGSIPVKNYKVEFVGIFTGTASMDKDGRLVRLLIPAQDLEVVRKDLLPDNPQN